MTSKLLSPRQKDTVTKALVVGVDAGASSTKALASDIEGKLVGFSSGPPANPHAGIKAGAETMIRVLMNAATKIRRRPRIGTAVFGVTGSEAEKTRRKVFDALHALLPDARLRVVHDSEITLYGAFRGAPGIVIYSGTGSFAVGKNRWGETCRVGGLGFLLSDEGSGFSIGRSGLVAAVMCIDGRGPPTTLARTLLDYFKTETFEDVGAALYRGRLDTGRIAALTPIILKAAKEGDRPAFRIVHQASLQLVSMVCAVRDRLSIDSGVIPVATGGGVFDSKLMRDLFRRDLKKLLPRASVIAPLSPPVVGAALIAFHLGGVSPQDRVIRNLTRALSHEEST